MSIAVVVLLSVAVLACLCSGLGLLAMHHPLDRLHYTGVATVLGTIPLTIAALLHAGSTAAGVKTLAVGLVILTTAPVLTHATGRAILTRTRDRAAGADWELHR